jgi:adenylate kinase family enzyme
MRVRYFFTGKPGVGKTTIAEKLSLLVPSVKISTDSLCSTLLGSLEVYQLLITGHEITEDMILEAFDSQVKGDESAFKGYILDGIPIHSSDASIRKVREILETGQDKYINVMVHLSIEDEVLVRRRAAQWLDPKSKYMIGAFTRGNV